MSQQRGSNSFKCLDYGDGRFTRDQNEMEKIARSYLEDLFTMKHGMMGLNHILIGVERCITEEANIELTAVYTVDEVDKCQK